MSLVFYVEYKMKKIVFLHGSGADKNRYAELCDTIAKYCGCELVCFNAPFTHYARPDKYQWFGKFENSGHRDAVISDYEYSLRYIKDKILALNCNTKDIVLIGHSQGGGMAVHIGLEKNLGVVVAICPDLPYNIKYDLSGNTPIYWLEAAKDTLLDDNRKQSYKLLPNGVDFHYAILPNSGHKDFENDFMNVIKNNEIPFLYKNTR